MTTKLTPVQIIALVEDTESGGPIIVLHDKISNSVLPIWVGEPEARAISFALNNVTASRPLTHTLFLKTLEGLDGHLSRVVVDRLERSTYYASIYLTTPEKTLRIDARPSDAIALALEARVPMFVGTEIMNAAGQENPFPDLYPRETTPEISPSDFKRLKMRLVEAREREQKSHIDNA